MINITLPVKFTKSLWVVEREALLRAYRTWLMENVGERFVDWGFNLTQYSGWIESVWVTLPEDALAFKLKFGL